LSLMKAHGRFYGWSGLAVPTTSGITRTAAQLREAGRDDGPSYAA
jgi:hypothetical protein